MADSVVVSQIRFGEVRKRGALIQQDLAFPVNVNFLQRRWLLCGIGCLRKAKRWLAPTATPMPNNTVTERRVLDMREIIPVTTRW